MQACLAVALTTTLAASDRAICDQEHEYQIAGYCRASVGTVLAGSKLRSLAQAQLDLAKATR